MNKPQDGSRQEFAQRIASQEQRKAKMEARGRRGLWGGIGAFGVIGWSIAMPTVLGALLGMWLDRRYPSPHSWTLALIVAGLTLGCFMAWRWVANEQSEIHREES